MWQKAASDSGERRRQYLGRIMKRSGPTLVAHMPVIPSLYLKCPAPRGGHALLQYRVSRILASLRDNIDRRSVSDGILNTQSQYVRREAYGG